MSGITLCSTIKLMCSAAGAEGGPLTTYTIMTVDSAPQLRWLHDRMPVILDSDRAVQAWLTGTDSKPQVG